MKNEQKRFYVDSETGEAYDLVAVPRSQSKSWNRGGFFMGMLAAFDDIANADWPDGDYKIFIKLLGRLDFENYLHLDVKELADEMGRSRETVSRAVSRFVERGILHRGPRVGRSYTYRLDPSTAWRGKSEARDRLEREIRERNWTVIEGEK
jgi:hypothetical protein